jgi:hypothetical protein
MERSVIQCHFPTFVPCWSCLRPLPPHLLTGFRVPRLALLNALIIIVWYKTDFPWDDGCRTYIAINVGSGALLLVRGIRWPGFLGLIFLTWFLSAANWRRF